MCAWLMTYRQTSTLSCTLVGNQIIDLSDIVGASPVGAAPTTSSFSIYIPPRTICNHYLCHQWRMKSEDWYSTKNLSKFKCFIRKILLWQSYAMLDASSVWGRMTHRIIFLPEWRLQSVAWFVIVCECRPAVLFIQPHNPPNTHMCVNPLIWLFSPAFTCCTVYRFVQKCLTINIPVLAL